MPGPADSDATGAYRPDPTPPPGERFAPGEVLAGRYRVVAPLGRGGMGEVYRADDITLGRPVALKFLPPHLAADPDRLARFRREVAAARRVSHPHVCRVYDIADHDGQPFLTMEFVDGEDLSSVLKRLGRVPEEKGTEIARQLCGALAAVHDQALLHRDLKPANVMLDGRGKVRLTDFGLAAAADVSATEVRSGTPLYQAPEQLAGREVTVRSDLYALGLVLYELFTGRRAFPDARRDTPPGKPTSHVSTLSAGAEAVILRCLEANPANRPRSAAEVLAALPGGDPLAAAVAAGETPSPRLVADAPVEGELRPAVATALFAGVVALLLLAAGLNDRYKAHRYVPFPPPAVLEEKARSVIQELGYTDPPADAVGGFEMPREHSYYLARNDSRPAVPVEEMGSCRPAILVYWYRRSPKPLLPARAVAPEDRADWLTSRNPPTDVPGMVTLWTDTRGRLVGFLAVPEPPAAHPAAPLDWDAVLKLAGLHAPGVLRPDPAARPTPPVFADHTRAWTGAYPERPDLSIRVEAAEYRGRLVYFRITHPDWGDTGPVAESAALLVATMAILGLTLAGVFCFALRNVRRGRADVRGGLRVAAAVGGLQLFHQLATHVHFSGWRVVTPLVLNEVAWALYSATVVIACYLALEPLVRRRCPHRLTAWTRLTEGRWRDPLVGRHVLVGLLVGLASAADWPFVPFWPATSGVGPSVAHITLFTRPVGELAGSVAVAVTATWVYAGMFAVLLTVSRREWVAVAFMAGFFTLSVAASGLSPVSQGFAILRVAALITLFLRCGVLAVVAAYVAINVPMHCPLTLDSSTWYFGASLTYLAVFVGLAGYGFYTATGGRLFAKGFFGDD